ncbi:MAG: DUF6503 family protein [Tunicatimonas sp.]
MKNYLPAVALWLGLIGCQPAAEKGTSSHPAQRIINQAITAHGGEALSSAHISFNFRKKHYEAVLDQGQFTYQSTGTDSTGAQVHDVLTNEGFTRTVNGQSVTLNSEDQQRFGNSLNSVVYFVLLPYPLNDPAVSATYLEEASVRGEPYHKIRVTFSQAGGGDDFDDEYIYWIHQDQHTVDYLAYSFEVNGGGTRFREAYNTRVVNGIRFDDYINYESTVDNFALADYDQLFEAGQVKELSRIDTENIEVKKPDA